VRPRYRVSERGKACDDEGHYVLYLDEDGKVLTSSDG